MNKLDDYMNMINESLKQTTDPFAKKHGEILKSLVRKIATDNWINNGDPILNQEQMNWVYAEAKRKTRDKSWEIVGPFNICMN